MKTHLRHLFLLWFPLSIMWIVMAFEQPIVTGVIARLDDAVNQLASFGFAFSLALLIEGPVVQMLSAGTALSGSKEGYKSILSVMHVLAVVSFLLHAFLCIPSVFSWISLSLMHLPKTLVNSSWKCFLWMLPWTPTIGYRRLWQGVLIKHGETKKAPLVMYCRLLFAGIFLLIGYVYKPLSGASLAGATMGLVAIVGMFVAWILVNPILKKLVKKDESYSFKSTLSFYFPLAITSFITLGIRPLLNAGIPRGRFPVASLAIWPVILGYVCLYTALSQSVQEIVIAEYSKAIKKEIKFFVFLIACTLVLVFFLVLFLAPLRNFWFLKFSKVPKDLISFIIPSLFIMSLMPFFATFISYFRGLLVCNRLTKIITAGVIINVLTLCFILFLLPLFISLPGVYNAAIAFSLSYIFECIFLFFATHKVLKTK